MSSLSKISLDSLKGIGPKLFEKLNKLGLYTLQDMLFFLPYKYQDRTHLIAISDLEAGNESLTQGSIVDTRLIYARQRMLLCRINDQSGQQLTLKFFHFNQQQHNSLTQGRLIRCFGEIRQGRQGLEMTHPEYRLISDSLAPIEETYTPVYHQVQGISQAIVRKLVLQALQQLSPGSLEDYVPHYFLDKYQYPSLMDAILFLHHPPVEAHFSSLSDKTSLSHQRLAFEELLAHQLSVRYSDDKVNNIQAPFQLSKSSSKAKQQIEQFLDSLAFDLTNAQQRVIKEISQDLNKKIPMSRLLQGDVGSGKTVVAAITSLYALSTGFQVALMAPTELLAEQLLTNLENWFKLFPIKIAYLSGKVKGKLRKEVLTDIVSNEANLVIGTHALFQDEVRFNKLGLVIIDEQHRFGVHQRLSLRAKGKENTSPHLLIMTATPIPRTLAMTAYADLACSIIDELPLGRKPIKTIIIPQSRREEMIERIYQACKEGKQCYWICTLIEESEVLQCQAAEKTYEDLQIQLDGISVGLVHGRMKNDQKSSVMSAFKNAEIQLLIATTVVEVGVDVPNASLMIIENAERLGLSQLHQLRGRVGRGSKESVCALIYGQPISQQGKKRLKVIRETNDGFKIAEQDLKIRGPGEFLGTHQTGLAQMKIADLMHDQDLIPYASEAAQWLMENERDHINDLIKRWIGEKIIFKDA